MKQHFNFFMAIACALSLMVGCNNNSTVSAVTQKDSMGGFDVNTMKKIIREKNEQFTRAHVTGDHWVIDTMFTEDARSFPPNADAVIGRTAIALLTAGFIKFGVQEFREETTALYGNADYLVDEGNYFMRYGKDSTSENGKYINVWKKTGGDWKIYSNIWNSNMPATAAK
ncbi:MAG: nuclear transport factor 2 family protein [Chitinophagaceae bacterium]|nr:nuclear transport factor 2 family protein [Chitinophagaceae bacterium]MBK7308428.1 nuclear transport factor 2 family protein [Chitinophagaceae bacterium]